jgi:glycosyltransferase involved in cell wall biosynthesis
VERSILLSTQALVERGHCLTVVGGDPVRMSDHLLPLGVDWVPAASTYDVFRALRRIEPCDIVHAHMTAAEWAAVLARHRTGGALVMTRHFAQRRGRTVRGRLASAVIDRVTHHELAISQFVAGAVASESVVYHGIDDRPPALTEGKRVVVIQRLEPEKCTDLALRAWARSGLGDEGWELILAGDGSERSALESLAHSTGVSASVTFLGRVEDVDELRATAAMQFATPANEHFGLSVLEAMAVGLPVVAADGGAHRELLGQDQAALLFAIGDVDAAAERLRGLADDGELRRRVGRALRARQQERFSLDAHGEALEAAYRAAIAQQSVPGGRRGR